MNIIYTIKGMPLVKNDKYLPPDTELLIRLNAIKLSKNQTLSDKPIQELINEYLEFLNEVGVKLDINNPPPKTENIIKELYHNQIFIEKDEILSYEKKNLRFGIYCFRKYVKNNIHKDEIQNNLKELKVRNTITNYIYDLNRIILYLTVECNCPVSQFMDKEDKNSKQTYDTWHFRKIFDNQYNSFEEIPRRSIKIQRVTAMRIAIELLFMRAIGVHGIYNSTGKPVIVKTHQIIRFYKNEIEIEKNIKLNISPYNLDTLQKIIQWTQKTIHNNQVPSIWQIDTASEVLKSLFHRKSMSKGLADKGRSLYTNVIVNDFYQARERFKGYITGLNEKNHSSLFFMTCYPESNRG